MLTPLPHQIAGAVFLSGEKSRLLADEPRVGKTGAAIMAADLEMAERILVITTASGCAVWRQAFSEWSGFNRPVCILPCALPAGPLVAIVSWSSISEPKTRAALLACRWSRLISDEDHYAKSIDTKRTQALYGRFLDDGAELDTSFALTERAGFNVWLLTGTPQPNTPSDWYPRLRSLRPECLQADPVKSWPDVTKYRDFLYRYCIVKMKKLSNWNKIPVVVGSRNLAELKARVGDFALRRTQEDVGIRPPVHTLLPILPTKREMDAAILAERAIDRRQILNAAATGTTRDLSAGFMELLRLTGEVKAKAVIRAMKEEFDCGLDKIVLAYWHKGVGQILREGLLQYGPVLVDGATTADDRSAAVQTFTHNPKCQVFIGQIAAAGEAIDLSASANLLFVQTSLSPAQMKQMSLRITNHAQKRQALVRVAALEGSIDEALQMILLRKVEAIREVLGQ